MATDISIPNFHCVQYLNPTVTMTT